MLRETVVICSSCGQESSHLGWKILCSNLEGGRHFLHEVGHYLPYDMLFLCRLLAPENDIGNHLPK
jgi:hypothetical protein